ncbi:MAG: PTS sugar transporter subunit IIA, partial [Candidatus Thiodiazotropha sp.]
MIKLDSSSVRLDATATDKTDAIRQVGRLLVDAGFIEPAYVESLLARERVANT